MLLMACQPRPTELEQTEEGLTVQVGLVALTGLTVEVTVAPKVNVSPNIRLTRGFPLMTTVRPRAVQSKE